MKFFSTARRIAAASILTLAVAGFAAAQKIAIIDMQQALLATSDGQKAAAEIDAKYGPIKADMDKLQKQISDKQDAMAKGRSTMSPAALTAAQQELQSLTTQVQRKQEDAQQDLQEDEARLTGPIVQKLTQVINQYTAANQITFVVDTSANPNNLVYADGSLNIGAQIVAAYEKAAGTPAAATPAKPAASTTAPAATKTTAPAAARPAAPSTPKPATPSK